MTESDVGAPQDFCDWCPAKDMDPSYKIDVERFSFDAWFCSLECAVRWGCAADQQHIERVAP